MSGRIIAITIAVATVVFVILGTIWPVHAASILIGQAPRLGGSGTPQAAVENLLGDIGRRDFDAAYSELANKSQFSQADLVRDLGGNYPSLRKYATLSDFDMQPLHSSEDQASYRVNIRWSSVVGVFEDTRDLQVTRDGSHWAVVWPIVKEQAIPPQVIPVNYLRWDVIYRGAADDWGAQNVESPHIRIIDMRPTDRGSGVMILGEVLNEDTVPAFVTVKGTLVGKNGATLGTEGAFDKILHILMPKQVTPFRIDFPGVSLSQVDSVRMQPSSNLVAASADPVIEVDDQKLTSKPDTALTGQLLNQSGTVVDITHVLGTFYDSKGQLVWVGDSYLNRALLPKLPSQFSIPIPPDVASNVATYRVVTTAYSSSRFQ